MDAIQWSKHTITKGIKGTFCAEILLPSLRLLCGFLFYRHNFGMKSANINQTLAAGLLNNVNLKLDKVDQQEVSTITPRQQHAFGVILITSV